MSKEKTIVIAFSESDIHAYQFDNSKYAEGFCEGWSSGASEYGAGSCHAFIYQDDDCYLAEQAGEDNVDEVRRVVKEELEERS